MGGNTSKPRKKRPTRREVNEKESVSVALEMGGTVWRKERKRQREEVKRLREEVKRLREEVKWLKQKMEMKEVANAQQHEWEWVVEQMFLERAMREKAVERWKQLCFAIKNELDDLIHIAYGEALREKPQELRKELKFREETIETLKGTIALMEKQQNGKEREIDLLRQSLRILGSNSGKNNAPSSATRNFLCSSPEKLTDAND